MFTSPHGQIQFLPPTDNKVRFLHEIRNRYRWLLSMGGIRIVLLKRKWDGIRCECFDPIRKQSSRSECPDCFGTQFVGGYVPQEIMASFVSPSRRTVPLWSHGMWTERSSSSWTAHDPELTVRDIMVNDKNERFEITEVTPTMWRGHVLRQDFGYRLIEPSSVAYSFNVAGGGALSD